MIEGVFCLAHVLPELIEEEEGFMTCPTAPTTGGSVDIYLTYLSE